jgi:uncharacterized membrane protein YbhN (UPF0104 family)
MRSVMPPTRRQALVVCAFVAFTAFVCAALLSAAALAPAPTPVLPLVVVVCIGCPMAAAYELPAAIAGLRRGRRRRPLDLGEVDRLRRQLEALPETHHPLDL